MNDQRPSSMDELFSQVRNHDPVPEGTVERVATRLETRPRLSFSPWLAAGLAAIVVLTLWSQLPRSALTPSLEPTPSKAPIAIAPPAVKEEKVPPLVPQKTATKADQEAEPHAQKRASKRPAVDKAIAAPKLQAPKPHLAVEPRVPPPPSAPELERAKPLPPTTPGLRAAERLASGASLAPSRADPPRFKERRSTSRYRPRAIVEFQRVDWDSLETQTLPAHFQPIINARDRRGLLAALDELPLQKRPGLLVVRGELRAGASRCTDAMADFSHVLSSDDHAARRRASYGRSICQDILQKTF